MCLFESVAAEYGAVGRGLPADRNGQGRRAGLLKIRAAGGLTIAQDETTSVIYGMPREAAMLGAATHVLRLGDIGTPARRVASQPRRRPDNERLRFSSSTTA